MNELIKILEFVTEHGFATLVSVISIMLFIMLFIRQNKLLKQQTAFSQELFEQFFKKKENTHSEFKKEVEGDMNTAIHLSEARASMNADIIAIYTYHNTILKKSGLPFNKSSCVMERQKPKVNLTIGPTTYKDIPTSFQPDWNMALLDNKPIIIPDVKSAMFKKEGYGVCKILEDKGINALYAFGLYDLNQNLTGWVSFEFIKPTEWSEKEILRAKQYVYTINHVMY